MSDSSLVAERPRGGAAGLAASVFDFELPETRLRVTLALLAIALLGPNIFMPAPLPAVRIEQVGMIVALFPLVRYLRRHPEARRVGPIDFAFLALTVAIAISVVLAPFVVPAVGRSIHDVFDIVRPFYYWLLYRLALTVVPSARMARLALATLFVCAVLEGAFAFLQFLAPAGFNQTITSIWATGHNLDGVIRGRRAVGTADNADVFAMLAALAALGGIWTILLLDRLPRRRGALVAIGLGMSILGFVLALSRGATIAALFGLAFGVFVVLLSRRHGRWIVAFGLAAAFAAVATGLTFVVPTPQGGQSAASRFNVSQVSTDSSVVLRVARLRLLFGGSGATEATAGLCSGSSVAPPSPGHDPSEAVSGASPAVLARDAQRKEAVASIAAALDRSYCTTHKWPVGNVSAALAAAGLSSIPADPSTGQPYSVQVGKDGYSVSARLENPADPSGPLYVATNEPNLVLNPSFDQGTSPPNSWITDGTSKATAVAGAAPFGGTSADVSLVPGGYLSQYVVYTLPNSVDYTASIWLRSLSGTEQQVRFYVTEILADGSRVSPAALATPTLPADGSWVRSAITFQTPKKGLVYTAQVIVQTATSTTTASVGVDAASLTATDVAPAYATLRDVDPATLRSTLPSWLSSPVVGLGPLNVLEIGGDPGEYALMLIRFGALGMLAYLSLFGLAAWLAFQVWRRGQRGWPAILALTGLTATAVGAVFAATTSSFYNYQLMAVYWLLLGLIAAFTLRPGAADQDAALEPAAGPTPGSPGP